ncbi:major facilitator superfamily MFS-1 [Babesia ovata]|uniref:Major facilitator superfamily MFS-1 n=1 Tax=Babesia ovata TaxID=189622 RepID=A0A2H6KCU2_9APIC|nr:major facilitator superfamily MFS-1 [Babesia ovata]GBE60813.1 major facilitator superfamily MFS-1 [Babesia ovata]
MKVHWITRLLIYSVIATFVGPFYDNWSSTEKYLYRQRAYIETCATIPPETVVQDTWHCEEQRQKLSLLLPISRVAECFLSVVIGIFMDFFGPRLTTVIGIILRIVGWTLMGFAVNAKGGLIAAFFITGLSTNFIVFPALTIGMYNERFRYVLVLVIGMLGSPASMLMKLKLMMLEYGLLTAHQVNYLYTIVFILPSLLLAVVFMPARLENLSLPTPSTDEASVPKVGDDVHDASAVDGASINAILDDVMQTCDLDSDGAEHDAERTLSDDTVETKWTVRGLLRTLCRKEVVVSLFYFAFNFSSITYVQQTFTLMHKDNPYLITWSEYVIQLAAVPCVIFAVLYMYINPIWILIAMNAMGMVTHLLLTTSNYYAGIFLSLSLVTTYSIINTQVYNYLDSIFDATYMGSIVGALNTMCGIWMLSQALILESMTSETEILVTTSIMAGLRFLFLIPYCFFLYKSLRVKRVKSKASGFSVLSRDRMASVS